MAGVTPGGVLVWNGTGPVHVPLPPALPRLMVPFLGVGAPTMTVDWESRCKVAEGELQAIGNVLGAPREGILGELKALIAEVDQRRAEVQSLSNKLITESWLRECAEIRLESVSAELATAREQLARVGAELSAAKPDDGWRPW